MKLQDYLKSIRECPDDELSDRFGVGDNQVILTKTSPKDLSKKIRLEFKNLEFKKEFGFVGGRAYQFYYVPGTIVVNVVNSINVVPFFHMGLEEYVGKLKQDYFSSIIFHTEQGEKYHSDGKRMPIHDFRVSALCTEEIVDFMLKEKIHFCIPAAQSGIIRDTSKIVYSDEVKK
jgi:hypothetical protein